MTEMDDLISVERLDAIIDGFTGLEVCALADRLDCDETLKMAVELKALRRASLSPAGVTEEQVEALTKTFCGDKLNGGVLRDMAFTVWQKCQKPTHEDGNTDWFNDTLPIVDAAVEQLRAALEAAAKAQPSADAKGDA